MQARPGPDERLLWRPLLTSPRSPPPHPTSRSCEGCASLRELPALLAAALPLRCLNLLHSGVLRLPLAARARLLGAGAEVCEEHEDGAAEAEEQAPAEAAAEEGAISYLRHLTELRWGAPEWGAAAGGTHRFVGASGALSAELLPDLSPLLQASRLQVLQLAHLPGTPAAEAQLAVLRRHLPRLRSLQANSARLLG